MYGNCQNRSAQNALANPFPFHFPYKCTEISFSVQKISLCWFLDLQDDFKKKRLLDAFSGTPQLPAMHCSRISADSVPLYGRAHRCWIRLNFSMSLKDTMKSCSHSALLCSEGFYYVRIWTLPEQTQRKIFRQFQHPFVFLHREESKIAKPLTSSGLTKSKSIISPSKIVGDTHYFMLHVGKFVIRLNQNNKWTHPDIHISAFHPTPAAENKLILFAD